MSTASNAGADQTPPAFLHRRSFLAAALGFALAGCKTTSSTGPETTGTTPLPNPRFARMYAARPNERFPVPAINISAIDERYLRQQVSYRTPEPPGTIIVDPDSSFLYLVQENGMALRYGVGVGREGFGWNGRATIMRKAEWPTWTPTRSMIEREPELEKYAKGMPPGLDNPLGARALYLYQNGRDTMYRLHGTNEPHSIGQAVSSGCIRLFNQDIIDLYNRTPLGTSVVVLTSAPRFLASTT